MINLTVVVKVDSGVGKLKTIQRGTFDIEFFKKTFDTSIASNDDMKFIQTDEDWVEFIISNSFIKKWITEYIPYETNPVSEINPYGIGCNITILEWYRDGKLIKSTN